MRLLHTMLRVGNLNRSIDFYTKTLGMTLLRQKDYPQGKFTLAFLGYGDESSNTAIELTHNWDTTAYEIGNAFGHIAIEVEDVYASSLCWDNIPILDYFNIIRQISQIDGWGAR